MRVLNTLAYMGVIVAVGALAAEAAKKKVGIKHYTEEKNDYKQNRAI